MCNTWAHWTIWHAYVGGRQLCMSAICMRPRTLAAASTQNVFLLHAQPRRSNHTVSQNANAASTQRPVKLVRDHLLKIREWHAQLLMIMHAAPNAQRQRAAGGVPRVATKWQSYPYYLSLRSMAGRAAATCTWRCTTLTPRSKTCTHACYTRSK